MRRHLLIAAACLLAGAGANVLVAWGCAIWIDLPVPKGSVVNSVPVPWERAVPADWPPIEWAGSIRRRGGARWTGSASRWANAERLVGEMELSVFSYGCPALAMERQDRFFRDDRGRRQYVNPNAWIDGWQLPGPVSARLHAVNSCKLPLHPIWPGFAANTGAYAMLAWGIGAGVPMLRRAHRCRRGHCPECNYDLVGKLAAGCPECGWGRA